MHRRHVPCTSSWTCISCSPHTFCPQARHYGCFNPVLSPHDLEEVRAGCGTIGWLVVILFGLLVDSFVGSFIDPFMR